MYLNENSFVQVKNAYAESNIRDSKKKIIINSREMDIINLNQKIRNLPLIGLLLSETLGKVNLESK